MRKSNILTWLKLIVFRYWCTQTRSPGYVNGGTMIVDALTAQQLMTILEEDYIELDDLICPLLGID